MIWKFLKQNVLFPRGLNWVQHWVSRIGQMAVSTFFLDCSSLCWDNYKLVLSSHNLCKNIFIIVLKPKFLRKILPWVEGPHAWLQLCEVSLRKTKEKENHETFLAKFIPILRHGPKYTWLYSCSFHWCSLLELWIKRQNKKQSNL